MCGENSTFGRVRKLQLFAVFALSLTLIPKNVSGANILAAFVIPSISHQVVYRSYATELSRRGHNVTVITADPVRDPTLKNYTEIDMSFTYKMWNEKMLATLKELKTINNFPEIFLFLFGAFSPNFCRYYLSSPQIQDLIKGNTKFDLLVTEFGIIPCIYGFAKLADYKHIGMFSMQSNVVVYSNFGNPVPASFIPDMCFPYLSSMTFFQRVRTLIFQLFSYIFYGYTMETQNKIIKEYFGNDVPSIYELERNISALLLNSHFTMSFPRPALPNIVEMGGPALHLHGKKPKSLPKDIKEFLDNAKDGVIYFSLGSNVKTGKGFEAEEKILIECFSKIKQKVLWKWENENLVVNLENVKMSKWFPQVDILAHPNTRAFVTQGGLQSIGEAVAYNVPLIVMPFFADQGFNAVKMESMGAAIVYDFDELTVEGFSKALNEIVYNTTYKENIIKLSGLVKDQPMHPLDKAIWWTEYVIRHNGAPHLRSVAATMPWYQYFMLDVLAVAFLLFCVVSYSLYKIVSLLFKLMFKRGKSKTD